MHGLMPICRKYASSQTQTKLLGVKVDLSPNLPIWQSPYDTMTSILVLVTSWDFSLQLNMTVVYHEISFCFPCVFLPLFSVRWLCARSPVTLPVFPHASAVPPDHSHRHSCSQPCAQSTDRFLQFPAIFPEECSVARAWESALPESRIHQATDSFGLCNPPNPPVFVINISRVNEAQAARVIKWF